MSVNYQDWKAKPVSIGSLFLDPENPRIPPGQSFEDDRALIEEMVTHEDVLTLAKNIAENGFFPSEPLVAVKENGKLLVVEGNRRLAACKALTTPEAAPHNMAKRFRALAGTFDTKSLAKLPVVIAPTRESTIPLIIARHTATQIAKWQPAMQAHFYSNLLAHGLTVEEVAQKFGLKAAEIREALHAHHLYKMACRLPLTAATAGIVKDPRQFSLTTLGRVFDTPHAKQFFGVEFLDDGRITGSIEPKEFEKGFARVVTDIALKKQDSRTLHSAENIKRYLNGLPQDQRPNTKKKGVFTAESFLVEEAEPAPSTPPKPQKRPRGAGARVGLIPSSAQCGITNLRVRNLFRELQRLSPSKFPNASALVFRSFIEIAVYCFLDGKGEIAKMKQEYIADIQKRNTGKPPDKQRAPEPHWTPNLNGMMKRVSAAQHGLLTNSHAARALGKVINEEEELFGLNLSTHNPTYHPTEQRLRATWANLEEFFKEILA